MPTFDIPAEAQDVLRWVRAGYDNPPDRTPGSQSLAQMAFAVGRNFKVRGYACPYQAVAWDDPILGTFFLCRTRWDTAFLLQSWPHPQTGGKYLITATVERMFSNTTSGEPGTKPCPDCGGVGCETCQKTGRLPLASLIGS